MLAGVKFGGWAPFFYWKKYWQIYKFGRWVRYHHMYICKYVILADFNLAVAMVDCQTAKFNSLPNFLAKWYYRLLSVG